MGSYHVVDLRSSDSAGFKLLIADWNTMRSVHPSGTLGKACHSTCRREEKNIEPGSNAPSFAKSRYGEGRG